MTAGGTRYAYDIGIDRYEADLDFRSLTTSEKDDLQSFFHSTVDGSGTTFTYTDADGSTYTARFLNPTLEFTKTYGDVYDISLSLELNSMVG